MIDIEKLVDQNLLYVNQDQGFQKLDDMDKEMFSIYLSNDLENYLSINTVQFLVKTSKTKEQLINRLKKQLKGKL